MLLEQDQDTIAAVSTAPGTGGIAVVRVSGSRALEVTKPMAPFLPDAIESHRVYFGTLRDPLREEPVDEVLVTYFAHGRSFTGQEVLEISCHGGDWLAARIVSLLLAAGARAAKRGEFTYRAFMNGRLDLVQAEAVLSLIESRSQPAARAALRQLKGEASKRLEAVLDHLTWVAANLEANIDFAQEDIVVAEDMALSKRLEEARALLLDILRSSEQSRLWREGFHVALLGLPNVGKSSLLNALLQEERAIVTDVPGTTRDLVEGRLDFNGVEVRITDTAGLRESSDKVERIGIERSLEVARAVDMILFMHDGQTADEVVLELARLSENELERTRFVRSKADLKESFDLNSELQKLKNAAEKRDLGRLTRWLSSLVTQDVLSLSAVTGSGLDRLRSLLQDQVRQNLHEDSPMALKARHLELLQKALASSADALDLIRKNASPEFAAFELKDAVLALHEILGRRFDDQVMDRVFNEFCLGK